MMGFPQGSKRPGTEDGFTNWDEDPSEKFPCCGGKGCKGYKGYKGGKGGKGGGSWHGESGGAGGFWSGKGAGCFGGKGATVVPPRPPAAWNSSAAPGGNSEFHSFDGGDFGGGGGGQYLGPPLGGPPPRAPAPASYEQTTTLEFEIPAHKVKDVLGVKGRNIKAIKTQSGVQKIAIMDRSEPAVVTVTGSSTAIEKAKEMVLAVCSGNQSIIGNVVETMEIGQKMVSKFIGPKGQVITQLKEMSGAYLEVREPGGGHLPKIIMTGPPECVAKARELCLQFLAAQGSGGDGAAAVLSGQPSVGVGSSDPYSEYLAQARLQEGLIHAQLQEASIQATFQDGGVPSSQSDAFSSVQRALQAQLATQAAQAALLTAVTAAGGGGGPAQDLSTLLTLLALAGQQQPSAHSAGADLGQLLQLAAASAAASPSSPLGSLGALLPGALLGSPSPGTLDSGFGGFCGGLEVLQLLSAVPPPPPAPTAAPPPAVAAVPEVNDQVQQLLNALRVQMEAHSGG